MAAVKVLIYLLLLNVSVLFAENIAIIADGTGSLEKLGILKKYKEGLKTVVELIGIIDPNNSVTFVKFGDYNESKLIFSGRINTNNLKEIFSRIDEEWNPKELYKVRTSFYSGFSAVLRTGQKYDLTIFITDGFHNSKKKGLEDLKKEFGGSLKNLGKVLILHIKPSGGKLSSGAEKIIQEWADALNGELLYTDIGKLIQTFLNLILKHKIENYIVGYGTLLPYDLTLNKYYKDSTLHLIVYPAVKVDGKGKIYKGYKISYVQVKNFEGKLSFFFDKSWKKKFVFYYETGKYEPRVSVEPKRDYYFIGESVRISLKFIANKKEITDELFKSSMNYQFKLGNSEISPKKLKGNEIISISLKEKGNLDLYLRFSPFEDVLRKKEYIKVYSYAVRKKANLLNITVEPQEVYEFQKFIIKAEPVGLKVSSPIIRIEGINNKYSKVINLNKEGNLFTTSLSLRKGTYRIVPVGNFKLGGDTVINVHPRKIAVDIYKCEDNTYKDCEKDEDYSLEYGTSSRSLIFSLPVYLFMDGSKRYYVVKIRLKPTFDNENVEFKLGKPNKLKFKGEFEYYPVFQAVPVSFGTKEATIKAEINAFQQYYDLNLNVKLSTPENLKLVSEILPKSVIENLTLKLNDKQIGNYEVRMGLIPVGSVEFALYRTYIIVRNLIILGILAILTLILLYLRRKHLLKKKNMIREVVRYRGDEFWEEIPKRVRNILENNPKNLNNLIYDSVLAGKVAKVWDTGHLKKFLEKLKRPKENVEVPIRFGQQVEIYGFVSENWESNNPQVFLRDERMKGESFILTLKEDIEHNGNVWEINVYSSNFKLEKEKFSTSGKTNIYRDRVEGYFGNYKFTLKVEGDKGIIRLYKIRR